MAEIERKRGQGRIRETYRRTHKLRSKWGELAEGDDRRDDDCGERCIWGDNKRGC